jgi:hypothetical protein
LRTGWLRRSWHRRDPSRRGATSSRSRRGARRVRPAGRTEPVASPTPTGDRARLPRPSRSRCPTSVPVGLGPEPISRPAGTRCHPGIATDHRPVLGDVVRHDRRTDQEHAHRCVSKAVAGNDRLIGRRYRSTSPIVVGDFRPGRPNSDREQLPQITDARAAAANSYATPNRRTLAGRTTRARAAIRRADGRGLVTAPPLVPVPEPPPPTEPDHATNRQPATSRPTLPIAAGTGRPLPSNRVGRYRRFSRSMAGAGVDLAAHTLWSRCGEG